MARNSVGNNLPYTVKRLTVYTAAKEKTWERLSDGVSSGPATALHCNMTSHGHNIRERIHIHTHTHTHEHIHTHACTNTYMYKY